MPATASAVSPPSQVGCAVTAPGLRSRRAFLAGLAAVLPVLVAAKALSEEPWIEGHDYHTVQPTPDGHVQCMDTAHPFEMLTFKGKPIVWDVYTRPAARVSM